MIIDFFMRHLPKKNKDFFLLNLLLFIYFLSFSQGSDISFHSVDGVKFIVYFNEKLINKTADTTLIVQEISGKEQRIRIELQNKKHDRLSQTVIIKPGYLYEYEISAISGKADQKKTFSKKRYSLRLVRSEQKNENTQNLISDKVEPIVITMTYASDQYVTHYNLPGYNGDIGCPWPLTLKEYEAKLKELKEISTNAERLKIARDLFGKSCIFADEVREICLLLEEEDQRLDFAKFAYFMVFDQGNLSELQIIFKNTAIRNDFINFLKNRPFK